MWVGMLGVLYAAIKRNFIIRTRTQQLMRGPQSRAEVSSSINNQSESGGRSVAVHYLAIAQYDSSEAQKLPNEKDAVYYDEIRT
jgi:hypothetical protein